MTRVAERVSDALLPLAVVATAAAVIVPSRAVADRGDLVLAVLVALTALGIAPSDLWRLRTRWRTVVALSIGPFAVLVPLAWAIGRLFESPVREGVLALGFSSTEVAAVGLVGLAGGDAALALGALTGSLVAAATAGPLLIGTLADASTAALDQAAAGGPLLAAAEADPGELLGRFTLVVLLPLAAGVAARGLWPRLAFGEAHYAAGSTLVVVVLVYAALSGASAGDDVVPALSASAAFLALSGVAAMAWLRLAPDSQRTAGAFAIGLRDFAVAATLATQAFGPRAGAVGGAYGVLMLLAGAVMASLSRRRRSSSRPADRARGRSGAHCR